MFRIFKSKEIFNEVSYGYARHKKKLCGEISLTYGMGPNPSSRSPCAVQRMRRQCPRASNPRAPSPCPPAHACPPLLGLSHFAAVPTSPEGPPAPGVRGLPAFPSKASGPAGPDDAAKPAPALPSNGPRGRGPHRPDCTCHGPGPPLAGQACAALGYHIPDLT